MAHKLAACFETGELVRCSIDRVGISEMSIRWRNVDVNISWYSRGCLHQLKIGGTGFLGSSEAQIVLDAAQARAERLLSEELARMLRDDTADVISLVPRIEAKNTGASGRRA